MVIALRELDDFRFEVLERAKGEWGEMASRLGGYRDRMNCYVIRPLEQDWVGLDAQIAQVRLDTLSSNFQYGHQECSLIRAALDGVITELKGHQKNLRSWLDEAADRRLQVSDKGKVDYADEGDIPVTAPEDPVAPQEQHRREIEEGIAATLKAATETDSRYRELLAKLRVNRGLKIDAADAARDAKSVSKVAGDALGLDSAPIKGADPKDVNKWWNGLSDEEREEQQALHPDLIGNLDGIPATIRDKANRENLDRLIVSYQSRAPLSDDEQERMNGFVSIRNRVESGDGKRPQPFLLGIGDEGQGRAILSYGNPDTADNVAAYVPGLNTGMEDVGGGDGQRAMNVWQSAHKADPTQKTASIVWLGYDAPQAGASADLSNFAVAGEERGKRGGADFDHFLNGIHSTHEGNRPHVTAIGHSYGSFTVGQAAQREGGLPADDVVLVGSPGTGAQKADQLGVGAEHVWVGSAKNDPITHAPSKEEVGGLVINPVAGAIMHLADPHELWFGQDPASEDFGGRRFSVADGEMGSADSHSNYFDRQKGGASLDNIGYIATGRYDAVTGEAQR
ncbi:alpha/beta hydrolase [Streptomyces sp. NPDC048516]|uniref:alpha/beta hydrolase n=1 Tax=Streptomyces sp. NPDC048516 TaxID=3365565 RepID=UPI00371EF55E